MSGFVSGFVSGWLLICEGLRLDGGACVPEIGCQGVGDGCFSGSLGVSGFVSGWLLICEGLRLDGGACVPEIGCQGVGVTVTIAG